MGSKVAIFLKKSVAVSGTRSHRGGKGGGVEREAIDHVRRLGAG